MLAIDQARSLGDLLIVIRLKGKRRKMYTNLKFISCFLSLALVSLALVQAQDKSPQEMFQEAVQASQDGDHEKAVKLFLELEKAIPPNDAVTAQIGINYHMAGDLDNAIKYHRKLADSSNAQSKSNGLYNLACVYSLKEDKDNAFKYLKEAVVSGYSDIAHMKEDGDLANIKEDPRFDEMIAWIKNGGKEPRKLKAEDFFGNWKLESGMRGGSKIDSAKLTSIKISKEEFTIPSPEGEFVMAYKLKMDSDPIEVDFDIKKGPAPEGKAKGIIKMEDDKMTLCYHPKGGDRPKKFSCTEENGNFMFVMKKAMKKMADNPLAGKWQITKGMKAGADVAAERMASVITIDDKMITIPAGEATFKMSYTMDKDASPHTIDMTIEEGPGQGGKALGLVKMDGDKCMLIYDSTGAKRPEKFESTKDNGLFLFEMKKQ